MRTSPISPSVSAMFDKHTTLLFLLKNKETFHMFLLHDLRFVLCSRDLDVQRAQRIIGFFSLITHKSKRSEKWSDHMKVSHTVYRSSWRVEGFRIKKAPLEKKTGSIAFPLTRNWTKLWKLDFPTFFYNISQISPCYGEVLFFSAQHWLTKLILIHSAIKLSFSIWGSFLWLIKSNLCESAAAICT